MDTLRFMVKSILVIIVMAAFLEIVLPRSDMKRYINLIIGLFIIIAVVNPFLAVIHKGFSFDLLDNTVKDSNSETQALIQRGKDLTDSERNKIAKQYKEKLAKQIMALTGLSQDAKITGVKVEVVEDTASVNFGQVKKIVLQEAGQSDNNKGNLQKSSEPVVGEVQVDEIMVDAGKPEIAQTSKLKTGGNNTKALREMIANFYGLTPEQIVVQK